MHLIDGIRQWIIGNINADALIQFTIPGIILHPVFCIIKIGKNKSIFLFYCHNDIRTLLSCRCREFLGSSVISVLVFQADLISILYVIELNNMRHLALYDCVEHFTFILAHMIIRFLQIQSKHLRYKPLHYQETPYFIEFPDLLHANVCLTINKFE